MTIEDVEKIASNLFKGIPIDHIEETNNYFIITLKGIKLDGVHMIEKSTGKIRPYNPMLIKE